MKSRILVSAVFQMGKRPIKSFRKLTKKDSSKLTKAIEIIGRDFHSMFENFNPQENLVINFVGDSKGNRQNGYAQYRNGQIGFIE